MKLQTRKHLSEYFGAAYYIKCNICLVFENRLDPDVFTIQEKTKNIYYKKFWKKKKRKMDDATK